MSTSRWSEAQADALVEGAFMALLGRHPDNEGRRFYVDHLVHGRLSAEQFLSQLTASAEFADKALRWTSTPDHDRAIEAVLAQESVRDLSLRLASNALAQQRRSTARLHRGTCRSTACLDKPTTPRGIADDSMSCSWRCTR